MPFVYNDYVKRISDRYRNELSTILVGYNFDLGDEFEIAIAQILRLLLPSQFGVCRGFVVGMDGTQEGDDIIIYDQTRFPTLGIRDPNDFGRKEFIPIEAVYGYIEAKHSLIIDGDGAQSIAKATKQVESVKELLQSRKAVTMSHIDRQFLLPFTFKTPPAYPSLRNQPWGAIVSRFVRQKAGGDTIDDPAAIIDAISPAIQKGAHGPDVLLCGENVIYTPFQSTGAHHYHSPFSLPDTGDLTGDLAGAALDGIAPGVFFATMMAAFDWIRLSEFPWPHVVGDALGINVKAAFP